MFLDELNQIEARIRSKRMVDAHRLHDMREAIKSREDDEIVAHLTLRIDPDYFESRTHAPIHVGGHE